MAAKSFVSAFFRLSNGITVEFRKSNPGEKYEYNVKVFYNTVNFSWNTRQAPSITAAVRFSRFAKAEFDQRSESAKYE